MCNVEVLQIGSVRNFRSSEDLDPYPATDAPTSPTPSTAKSQVTIIRDEFGVPHVYARTARALFYGDGYATGQDPMPLTVS